MVLQLCGAVVVVVLAGSLVQRLCDAAEAVVLSESTVK